jgi:hypothetical protein
MTNSYFTKPHIIRKSDIYIVSSSKKISTLNKSFLAAHSNKLKHAGKIAEYLTTTKINQV